MRIGFAALAACFIVLTSVSAALAQSGARGAQTARAAPSDSAPPTRDETLSARELFSTALERIESGRFAEARDLLEKSLALVPRASTAFNLAVANRGTGDLLTALELLERLVQGQFGELSESQLGDVRSLREELESQIGQLDLTLRGAPQAEVRIDGDRAGTLHEDSAPLSLRVNPGRRIVTLTAKDREEAEESVRVDPGARVPLAFTLALTEEAKTGRLIVSAAKQTDTVEIVGFASARGHLEERLPAGTYTVRVENGKGSKKTTVTVPPRGTIRYQFDDVKTSLFRRPAFWVATGVVVTAAILTVVLVNRPDETRDPVSDPTYDVIEARVRWP